MLLYFYVCFTIASPFSMINFLFKNNLLLFPLSCHGFRTTSFLFPRPLQKPPLLHLSPHHYLLDSNFFLVTYSPKYLGAPPLPAGAHSINKNKALNDQGSSQAKKYCGHLYYMTSAVS